MAPFVSEYNPCKSDFFLREQKKIHLFKMSLNESKMDVTSVKQWPTPALVSFLYPSGDRSWLRWPSEKK